MELVWAISTTKVQIAFWASELVISLHGAVFAHAFGTIILLLNEYFVSIYPFRGGDVATWPLFLDK